MNVVQLINARNSGLVGEEPALVLAITALGTCASVSSISVGEINDMRRVTGNAAMAEINITGMPRDAVLAVARRFETFSRHPSEHAMLISHGSVPRAVALFRAHSADADIVRSTVAAFENIVLPPLQPPVPTSTRDWTPMPVFIEAPATPVARVPAVPPAAVEAIMRSGVPEVLLDVVADPATPPAVGARAFKTLLALPLKKADWARLQGRRDAGLALASLAAALTPSAPLAESVWSTVWALLFDGANAFVVAALHDLDAAVCAVAAAYADADTDAGVAAGAQTRAPIGQQKQQELLQQQQQQRVCAAELTRTCARVSAVSQSVHCSQALRAAGAPAVLSAALAAATSTAVGSAEIVNTLLLALVALAKDDAQAVAHAMVLRPVALVSVLRAVAAQPFFAPMARDALSLAVDSALLGGVFVARLIEAGVVGAATTTLQTHFRDATVRSLVGKLLTALSA
jgi:hypothetical protein